MKASGILRTRGVISKICPSLGSSPISLAAAKFSGNKYWVIAESRPIAGGFGGYEDPSSVTMNRSQYRLFSSSNIITQMSIHHHNGSYLHPTCGTSRHHCHYSTKRRGDLLSDSLVSKRRFSLSAKQIVDASPPRIQSYLRLCRVDRPIGTWLVYLPCTWSIAMAAVPGHLPDLYMLALFGAGAFLMRGAGCTINDMWDRDIDRQVRRTRDRPLACGQLTNFQALSFLGVQLSAALAILLTFDWYSVALGASSVLLVVAYPLMKRVTFWPHVFLGLTLNWGVLLAWCVLQGAAHWEVCVPLYTAGVLQTIIYDTIYAHRDKEDDLMIGVKSAALYLGDRAKTYLSGFGAVMIGCLALTGITAGQTWPYYLGVTVVAGHFTHQIYTVNLEDEEDCANKFRSNRNLGLMLFAAIVSGNLLRTHDESDNNEKECLTDHQQKPLNKFIQS